MSATSFSLSGNWTWSGPLPPEINGHLFGVWQIQHQVLKVTPVHKVPNWVPVFPLTSFPNATADTSESKFLKKAGVAVKVGMCINRKGDRAVSYRSPVVHRTHSVVWQFNTPSLRQQAPPESLSSSNVCFYEHILNVQKYCCCKQIYALTKKKQWTRSVEAMAVMHEYDRGFDNYVTFAYTFICRVMCCSQLAY